MSPDTCRRVYLAQIDAMHKTPDQLSMRRSIRVSVSQKERGPSRLLFDSRARSFSGSRCIPILYGGAPEHRRDHAHAQ